MFDHRDESGVTLIELVIAIMILGIIIVPLTGAMITGLISTGEAQQRLSESRSSLFTSAYFAEDAQSADPNFISVGGSPSWQCGSGTNVVSFGWTETTTPQTPPTSPPPYVASYVTRTANGKPSLVRNYCGSSGAGSSTVAPVLTAAAPTVTCSPACGNPAAPPRTITLVAATPNAENYFTLIASRRAT